jgi:hypothetical protein
MNCPACSEKLSDLLDGALSPAEAQVIESHLATCTACARELAGLRALRAATTVLPQEIKPARDLWPDLAARLPGAHNHHNEAAEAAGSVEPFPLPAGRSTVHRPSFWPRFAMAAGLALVGSLAWWKLRPLPSPSASAVSWNVASTYGTPRIGNQDVQGQARLHVGQWLVTDHTSRAKVSVGEIGEVSVEPNSRVRLVDTSATDHRIELARGSMSAFIWAPPRLFFVNTPSATAVDLGCAYTLAVDDAGNGELRVTSGYVALEEGDREAIIPRDFMCYTRRGAGPGTPFAVGAPDPLKSALQKFDFPARASSGRSVSEILTHARPEDAVTLWHLLARAPSTQRAAVYDALAAHHAPPASVTRAGILAGDITMRHAWAADLGLGTFAQR